MRKQPYLWQHQSGSYYVVYYDEPLGNKRRESLKTKDARVARDRLFLWEERRRDEERRGVHHNRVLLTEAVSEYLEHFAQRNKPSSVTRYRNALDNILSYLSPKLSASSLGVKDLADYQLHRVKTADKTTVDYEIDVARALLNWCQRRGWVSQNVADNQHLERLVRDATREDARRIFTDKELNILLAQHDGRYWQDYYVFNTLYYTGLRIAELGYLTDKDARLERAEILIRPKTIDVPVWSRAQKETIVRRVVWSPKAYEERIVPIEPRLAPILAEYEQRRHENKYGLYFFSERGCQVTDHISRKIKDLTGHNDISVHCFRHTHISHALNRWGRHPSVVQKWVGHKDLKTTMGYIHVSADDLHREAQKGGTSFGQSGRRS